MSQFAAEPSAPATIGPVCVVGLGYVGCVVAASLAARGQTVIGVDLRAEVVNAIAQGVAPIHEPGLAERIERAHALGTLRATTDLAGAVAASRASLVCVGTPVGPDGQLDVSQVLTACEAVARASRGSHTVVVRSTVPPGLYERACAAAREAAHGRFGHELTVALNPEFLREGAAVRDLEEPEMVVYATDHEPAARWIEAMYAHQADRLVRTSPENAEVLKLVCNAWHALKVAFTNEVSRVAGPAGVDAFAVMELLCRDRRLNTSAAYLRPGLPFGGACLTKDVASLSAHARAHGVEAPVLGSVLDSNRAQLEHFVRAVLAYGPTRVAVLGVGFKPGAADVRDSAPVRLVCALLDAGVAVAVADSAVLAARVPPLGLDALRSALGDARAEVSGSVAAAVAGADLVLAAHPSADDVRTLAELRPRVPVLDAAGELRRALGAEACATLGVVSLLGPRA